MARGNLAAVADETGEVPARTVKRRGKRGPMQFYVEYEIVDENTGTTVEGYKAKFVRVEKDKASVTKRVMEGDLTAIKRMMVVTVPLNTVEAAEATAEAA